MLLTEEEAKTKRCQESYPAASVITSDGATFVHAGPSMAGYGSSIAVSSAPSYCLGSGCMAWRWRNEPFEYVVGPPPAEAGWENVNEPGDAFERWRRKRSQAKGFCGKAGTP